MRRNRFLKLAALSGVVAVTGITFHSPLEAWARRFGAEVKRSDGIDMRLKNFKPGQLAESLRALHSAADGELHCAGSMIYGKCAGESFVLRFA